MSAARIGPVAPSSSRIRLRTGWAIARSTLRVVDPLRPGGPWDMAAAVPSSALTIAQLNMRKLSCAYDQASDPLARNHDFTVLWTGATISELGSRMSMFVFPLLAFALTGSAFVAALAESCSPGSGWPRPCCRPGCWPTGSTGAG